MNYKKIDVPVYFIFGRHDYQTPFELGERYRDKLEAPFKELIWFNESGHSPHLTESEKFYETLKEIKERTHLK